jgi:3-oxoadipate enol-lactonase
VTALFAQVDGDPAAPALLLGNSLGTNVAMWDAQAAALIDRFRLVRYDHRGHGRSPEPPGPYEIADLADDVIELLDRHEIENAHYCGLSIGGMVGIWLASHYPQRIGRLVVCCSSPYMPPASAWQERAAKVGAAHSTEPIADPVVDRWLTPDFAAEHPEIRARLRGMLLASPPDGYAAACGAIERMDLRPHLADVQAPTLVIGGEYDLAAPPASHALVIADGIPGARYELVPAAHVANVEQPELVTELIIEHLEAA